jgi:hypothetical protein
MATFDRNKCGDCGDVLIPCVVCGKALVCDTCGDIVCIRCPAPQVRTTQMREPPR